MAVCGRVFKEWCADPVRTQGGPSLDPVKRGVDFGVAACDCLSNIWRGSGGVFSGVVSGVDFGGVFGVLAGWFLAVDFGRVCVALPHGKKRRGGAGSGAGPAGRLVVFFLDFFGDL